MAMVIRQWWTNDGLQGVPSGHTEYANNGGWESPAVAIKELSQRFRQRVVHKDATSITYEYPLYVQQVSFY
jgi:hypothetical protein